MSFLTAGGAELEEALGEAAFYGTSAATAATGVWGLAMASYQSIRERAQAELRERLNQNTPERARPVSQGISPANMSSKRPRISNEDIIRAGILARYNRPLHVRNTHVKRNDLVRISNRPVYSSKMRLYRTIVPETKYLDLTISGTFNNTAWQWVNLSPIGQGTTALLRIGNKVYWTRMEIRGFMRCTGGTGSNMGQVCRVVLVKDKAPAGAGIPAAPSVFLENTVHSVRNSPQYGRFRMLRDQSHSVPTYQAEVGGTTVAQASEPKTIIWTLYPKCSSGYTDSGSTITSVQYNNFAMGFIATQNASCTYELRVKMLFKDV